VFQTQPTLPSPMQGLLSSSSTTTTTTNPKSPESLAAGMLWLAQQACRECEGVGDSMEEALAALEGRGVERSSFTNLNHNYRVGSSSLIQGATKVFEHLGLQVSNFLQNPCKSLFLYQPHACTSMTLKEESIRKLPDALFG